MNPSLDIRIGSMIRVLADIIIPNLQDALAVDQAKLVLGHLQIIRQQMDFSVRFELLECIAVSRLAGKICANLSGGPITQTAGRSLNQLNLESLRQKSPDEVRRHYDCLNAAIEQLIRASDEDGNERFRLDIRRLVLAESSASACRCRIWFGAMGFENREFLDTIPEMMKKFEVELSMAP